MNPEENVKKLFDMYNRALEDIVSITQLQNRRIVTLIKKDLTIK